MKLNNGCLLFKYVKLNKMPEPCIIFKYRKYLVLIFKLY